MRRNVTFLQKRYTNKNTLVLNNMEGLHAICFTEKNWTTEHYSCGGRKNLAKKLAQQLEVVLKK